MADSRPTPGPIGARRASGIYPDIQDVASVLYACAVIVTGASRQKRRHGDEDIFLREHPRRKGRRARVRAHRQVARKLRRGPDGARRRHPARRQSYAIIMWEVLSRQIPYDEVSNPMKIMFNVLRGMRPDTGPDSLSQQIPGRDTLACLMTCGWTANTDQRPSFLGGRKNPIRLNSPRFLPEVIGHNQYEISSLALKVQDKTGNHGIKESRNQGIKESRKQRSKDTLQFPIIRNCWNTASWTTGFQVSKNLG
ncbi:uncharacterized protein LOC144084962 isoform X3 [Stigmatopora argus]